jgi:hypothetical protein
MNAVQRFYDDLVALAESTTEYHPFIIAVAAIIVVAVIIELVWKQFR